MTDYDREFAEIQAEHERAADELALVQTLIDSGMLTDAQLLNDQAGQRLREAQDRLLEIKREIGS